MIKEHISYEDACKRVSKIRNGEDKRVFCLVIVSESCPFCTEMLKDVVPEVIDKFKDSIDFRTFDYDQQDSKYCIFPMTDSPAFLFYVRGGKPFPAVRQGAAPLAEVMKEVGRIVDVNKELRAGAII
jgi:hypothetical protein